MMNQRARQLGLRSTHFVRPDGLDAAGHVSTARDLTELGRVLMRKPFVRHVVAMHDARIAGGRHLTTWNDLLGIFPGVIGVKTGHTVERGLVPGRGRARPGADRLRDDPRQPDARAAQRGSGGAAAVGALALPRRDRDQPAARVRERRRAVRPRPGDAWSRRSRSSARSGSAGGCARRSSRPRSSRSRCSAASGSASCGSTTAGRLVATRRSSPRSRSRRRAFPRRRAGTRSASVDDRRVVPLTLTAKPNTAL